MMFKFLIAFTALPPLKWVQFKLNVLLRPTYACNQLLPFGQVQVPNLQPQSCLSKEGMVSFEMAEDCEQRELQSRADKRKHFPITVTVGDTGQISRTLTTTTQPTLFHMISRSFACWLRQACMDIALPYLSESDCSARACVRALACADDAGKGEYQWTIGKECIPTSQALAKDWLSFHLG